MRSIGIAGAGVLGRLLAWRLSRAGCRVTVFDPAGGPDAPPSGLLRAPAPAHAAAFSAAGMLSPLAELEHAGVEIARLGWRSIELWQEIAATLRNEGHTSDGVFQRNGSLLLAHPSDQGTARRVLDRLLRLAGERDQTCLAQPLEADALIALEPSVAAGLHGWWLPGEAQILPREMMEALSASADAVQWRWNERVDSLAPGTIHLGGGRAQHFDLCVDCRGVGSGAVPAGRSGAAALRGVRGELVWLHAPGVALRRPLRLLHPRHRVYIVPRPGDLVVVGASEIESADRSPVSLRSAVELLSAAHSVLPELAEARIVHMESNLRPALPDNRPALHCEPGLLCINGLFRHGWLLAPALVEDALTAAGLIGTGAQHHVTA